MCLKVGKEYKVGKERFLNELDGYRRDLTGRREVNVERNITEVVFYFFLYAHTYKSSSVHYILRGLHVGYCLDIAWIGSISFLGSDIP